MKTNFFLAILAVAVMPFISSCGEDEPKASTVGFDLVEDEANESDGTVYSFHPSLTTNAGFVGVGWDYQLKLVLNRPLSSNAVIKFSVGGNATAALDYKTDGSTLIIEKGATEAIIPITLYEDFAYEIDDDGTNLILHEQITVTLEEVVSGPIKINPEANIFTLNVLEDDFALLLDWDPQDVEGTGNGDVDLDIFYWIDGTLDFWSVSRSNSLEYVVIPGGYYEGNYGFSYPYYSGTSDNVKLSVYMFGYVNGQFYDATPFVANATYTLQNKNAYATDTEEPNVAIVQTMVKQGVEFKNVSGIQVPATGSRTAFPPTVSRQLSSDLRKIIKAGNVKTTPLQLRK
jgi:hypothetical protein